MSRIIKLLNNETIEIVEYSKANACFQTNKYPNDELFCVIREQINPFDMFQEKLSLEQEIERLNNIINELEKYLKENIKLTKTAVHFEILDDYDTRKYKRDIALFEMILDKLKELKESAKDER